MKLFFRLTPFFAIGIGVLGLIAVVDSWVTSRSYADWASTQGQVTYSEIVHGIGCGPGNSMSSMVIYEFEVDSIAYSSFNISNGMDGGSCGTYLVEEYPKGKKVTVYYDPENPDDSVLKLTRMNTLIAAFVAFLLLGMIVIGYFGWREMRKEERGGLRGPEWPLKAWKRSLTGKTLRTFQKSHARACTADSA